MEHISFDLWLEENREELESEWMESYEEGGVVERYENGEDFISWARNEWESEVLLQKLAQQR